LPDWCHWNLIFIYSPKLDGNGKFRPIGMDGRLAAGNHHRIKLAKRGFLKKEKITLFY